MRFVKPSVVFLWMTPEPLLQIERSARTCYKSEAGITEDSAKVIVRKLLESEHEAMIEHASMSYRVVCDRGVTHEIVRHRLFSYAQESTRYCNYKGGVTFILPPWINLKEGPLEACATESYYKKIFPNLSKPDYAWLDLMACSEIIYQVLLGECKWLPQQARSVLPNSLKTEIVITGNMREWRHFFHLRCDKAAHPQMQEIANMILKDAITRIPVLFDEFYL